MRRREFLAATSAAALSTFPLGWAQAQAAEKQKILYFTRSVGFEHSPVGRKGTDLSFSEKLLKDLGAKHDVEVVCTKDGTVFDGDLEQFDCFAFYTCGDLTKAESKDGAPPMTASGKKRLLDAVAAGKGFVGFHSASDTFHSAGQARENQTELDPYIAMLGGEFIVHGRQQKATMKVASPEFPGMDGVKDFELLEEWYALKNFAKDLHVILVQETEGNGRRLLPAAALPRDLGPDARQGTRILHFPRPPRRRVDQPHLPADLRRWIQLGDAKR